MSDSISSQADTNLPRIAIVGRSNVGKSTLFNRLIGRRKAITSPEAGVTRDFIEARCSIDGRTAILLDTGGFRLQEHGIEALVSRRSLELLEQVDIILLVVDVTSVTPEDEEFIEIARPYADKIILVVNKVDNSRREEESWNLHSLGFRQTVAVSAEHRRNLDTLERAISEMLGSPAPNAQATENEETYANIEVRDEIGISIIGKPNTGKSTLLNTLMGFERAIVNPEAGTTRDAIEGTFSYKGKTYRICDTGGIRRKRSVDGDVEYYAVNRAIESIGVADIVLLTIDAREGVTDQDKKISSIAVRKGKGILLVFNKWDLMKDIPNSFQAVSDRTRFFFPLLDFAPFLPISALRNTGIEEMLDAVSKVWAQLNIQIPTGRLNAAMHEWIRLKRPPSDGKKIYKARYITQTGTNPVKFLLFANRARGFPKSWVSFVKNRIRSDFGLSAIPISVDIREG